MMRGPSKIGMAVRKPDNEIELKVDEIDMPSRKYKFLQLPFIRGVIGLVESMYIGVNSLLFSASFFDDEEEESEGPSFMEKKFGDKAESVEMGMTVLLSLAITIVVFMILPNFIANFARRFTENTILLNLVEGVVRLTIFFIYLFYVSKLDEIERMFQYHGAEHKSIHCYENGEELTVENIKKYPLMHKRCGTSFLFMVMIISILVLSFFGWPNMLMRVVTRILAFPVIAGISYEINKFMGRYDNKFTDVLAWPGLMIQKYFTVKEPDGAQIETAILALKSVLPQEGESDRW
ncbi:MAG: DUF1385 domain-containing protein [Tissierellia bacterium]|nr:DUF1385 domain-containing protein [Tissierellia bacterium]